MRSNGKTRGLARAMGGLLMTMLLLPGLAGAQFFLGQDQDIPDVLVTFDSRLEPANARPGEHVRLLVTGRISEGWYTYSVVPQGDFAPPPTKLTLSNPPFEVIGPVYEINPPTKKRQSF